MNWIYLILAFIGVFLFRGLFYYLKLRQIRKLKKQYYEYISAKISYEFLQNKHLIISLFNDAGVKNFSVLHLEQVSHGTALQSSLDGFDNINSLRSDIVGVIKIRFEETIGVFRHEMRQSFNPIFWIEFIIKFPEKIISYLRISLSKSITNAIQLVFWIAGLLTFLDKFGLIDIRSWLN